MINSEIEFLNELHNDIALAAEASGILSSDAFFETICDYLVDAGELETADRAFYHQMRQGIRVDGYGGDPADMENTLSLIIADSGDSIEPATLTQTDLDKSFKRLMKFLEKALDPTFRDGLEESSPAFGLATMISERWPRIARVRMFVITDKILSSRIDGRQAEVFLDKPVSHSVWDLSRMQAFVESGKGREDIEIDLIADLGGPIPVLPAGIKNADYEAFLAVIPGAQLAEIYERWGPRLLEQNVRVFLQARGKVNKGMRVTLENEPAMFFAYNNGLSATAEEVTVETIAGVPAITKMRNFQIVNGGQTTASVHLASKSKDANLDNVYVQMKLAIVQPERVNELVPLISEYSNTQNRVNAADFFSNHPFHVRMEEFSRRVLAPSRDGSFKQTKWFYERARGQFQDHYANLTKRQRREAELEFPRDQKFTKTDLAKFLTVWEKQPHVVSLGAQKNFASFASKVGAAWEKREADFNESYFRSAVAKAIAFRAAERMVSAQSWYEGGYRANVVAYAIAKLAQLVEETGKAVDFERIWRMQAVSPATLGALEKTAKVAHDVLISPPFGMRNVTEWAKKEACWGRVSSVQMELSADFLDELISKEEFQEQSRRARKDQRELSGIQAQTLVVNQPTRTWKRVLQWGEDRQMLSEKESSILAVCAKGDMGVPSELQALAALEIFHRLKSEGLRVTLK